MRVCFPREVGHLPDSGIDLLKVGIPKVSADVGNEQPQSPIARAFTAPPQMGLNSRGRGGSIGRASASKSNGFHDQRIESRSVHKNNL